ncbi:MAG TPA: DUF6600 domain-containing protein [Terriglobales bacterium]|nr:DUF6600 domain-containing protein [Terriglobales bacterium]
MAHRRNMLVGWIMGLGLLLAPLLNAQDYDPGSDEISHARIVRLSHIEGTAQLDSDRGYENATENMPLSEGDRMLTRSDGWAEVQFEDGSTMRLAPDTQITFAQLGRNSDGGTVTAIDLDQGEVEFHVKKHDNSDFAVTAGNKEILLNHSSRFRVTSDNASPLEVVVWKGEVGIRDSASGSDIAVKKNETFTLDAMDLARYDLEKDAASDDLDQWSGQRDEALASYASAANTGYAQSPYQYGLNDLGYYGNYYDVPGYGYLWQPTGVNLGWDPFMNGYWSYCPGVGYTWVSAYPWGWMPYRYGRWIFVNGYGWMWQPGNWQGWQRTPVLVNRPPGFHPTAPPANTFTRNGPMRASTLPARVPKLNPGVSTAPKQASRFETDPDGRGHRVFSNEDSPGAPPVQHAHPLPAIVSREPVPQPSQSGPSAGGNQFEGRPRPVERTQPGPGRVETRPAEIPRMPESRPNPSSMHTQPVRIPAPAPAAPAPRVAPPPAPAPAPHVSSPPPAPRPAAAPPAPRFSMSTAHGESSGGAERRQK